MKKKKPQKRYNTVAAMINDLSGSRSEFARDFRAAIKKKRRHGQEINQRSLPPSGL